MPKCRTGPTGAWSCSSSSGVATRDAKNSRVAVAAGVDAGVGDELDDQLGRHRVVVQLSPRGPARLGPSVGRSHAGRPSAAVWSGGLIEHNPPGDEGRGRERG